MANHTKANGNGGTNGGTNGGGTTTYSTDSTIVNRFALQLDSRTATSYEQQAALAGRTPEELMSQRLRECVDQNSFDGRTVKVDVVDRQTIEKALGRSIKDGHELATYLSSSFTLACGDADVQLSPELLRRLATRAPRNVPYREFIGRIVREQLEHYVGLR
jgi:hypothetical protein